MLAQNSKTNYVEQAAVCAMSIKYHVPDSNICLITNDEVPSKYKSLFTDMVKIPWGDMAQGSSWKINNRWKIYHVTPYENTIVLDTDMLVLEDITRWWEQLQYSELFYVSKTLTYRGETVSSDFYRKAFLVNDLPNLYSGFHYFKKTETSREFFSMLEIVMKNWQEFYEIFAGGMKYQNFLSVDLCAAIAAKIIGYEKTIINPALAPTFVHMKSKLQNWKNSPPTDWQMVIKPYVTENLKVFVGNYCQHGIFHYTEDSFLTEPVISRYEKVLGI
jgi:hypothetical protein